jgi:uncharacterized protein (UPF0548 family)
MVGRGVDVAALAAADLTYPEHGATAGAALPAGYHHVERRFPLGSGRAVFNAAVDAVLGWRMHTGAGLTLLAAPPVAEVGAVVVLRFGPPVVGLLVPCRVVATVDEPGRRGFAYGTLPGHPERGEELFLVEHGADGAVDLRIRAFFRAATRLARAGGPVTLAVQSYVTGRYARALRRLVRAR